MSIVAPQRDVRVFVVIEIEYAILVPMSPLQLFQVAREGVRKYGCNYRQISQAMDSARDTRILWGALSTMTNVDCGCGPSFPLGGASCVCAFSRVSDTADTALVFPQSCQLSG